MKSTLLTLLLGACLWLPLSAQPASPSPTAAPTPRKLITIFDYRKELALTDAQVTALQKQLADLQTFLRDKRAQIQVKEASYRKNLESISIEDARKLLLEIANLQAEIRLADLRTSRAVTGGLTPEQLKKWREIQAKIRAAKSQ